MRPVWLASLLLLVAALPVRAQQAEDIARWTASAEAAAPGGTTRLHLRATIAPGWKLYALDTPPPSPPLRVAVQAPAGVTAGEVAHEAPPEAVYDSILEVTTRIFHDRAGVVVPLRVASETAPGQLSAPAEVTFTVCNATICLPPKKVTLTAVL
ncbi:MAG TPA: protein-disulfide reductase DsbD domain-containing protein, partial [Rhodothermales bacterium]|nr:protein-disulfide reductase DsbD domain-containing protein [Rhodothermales bacterium]